MAIFLSLPDFIRKKKLSLVEYFLIIFPVVFFIIALCINQEKFLEIDIEKQKEIDLGILFYKSLLYPFLISVLLERSIDVFSKTLREYGKQRIVLQKRQLQFNIKDLEEQLIEKSNIDCSSALEKEEKIHDLKKQLNQNEMESLKYRSETRAYTLIWAMICGLILSLCGVRILYLLTQGLGITIVSNNLFWGINSLQVFNIIDIVLSAGIIAGGSATVHEFMRVYSTLMEKTAENIGKAK